MPFPCRPGPAPGDSLGLSREGGLSQPGPQSKGGLSKGACVEAAWVRAIWVATKPAGRSRANRLEPSALRLPSPQPELVLVARVGASPAKPRIANPHTSAAH